jgi:tetratricopeptide (TPR) repeat protein
LLHTLEHDPGNFLATQALAELEFERGDYPAALNLLRQGLRANPGSVEHAVKIGKLQADMGRAVRAIGHYGQMIRQMPDDPQLRLSLAEVYLGLDQVGQAQEVLAELLRRWPDRTEALLMRAEAFWRQGLNKQALELYRRVYERGSKDPRDEAHYPLKLAQMGRFDLADRALAELLERDHWAASEIRGRVLVSYARHHLAAGHHEQARAYLKAAVKHWPRSPQAKQLLRQLPP